MKKSNIRIPWKQSVALLLFFAASFGVAAYSLGYFALPGGQKGPALTFAPFFPSTPSESTQASESTAAPNTDSDLPVIVPDQTNYLTNLSHAFNTSLIEGYVADRTTLSQSQRVAAYNKLAGIIETQSDGSPVGYQSYTADGHKLVRGSRFEGDFTDGTEVVLGISKVYSSEDGSYQTMVTEYTVDRKKVQPYMGYLILSRVEQREVAVDEAVLDEATEAPQTVTENVTVLTLCDGAGNLLVDDLGDKYPYYARDNQNRPVFADDAGKFYVFEDGGFVEIDEIDLRVWLRYDYPAYPLGVYNNYEAVYNPARDSFSYKNIENGRTAISTSYAQAFNFAENGLAVVVSASDNSLRVVNSRKSIQFRAKGYYSYPTGDTGHRLYAADIFRLPDTLGIESIGSAGYDHGWLRIRIQALSQMSNSRGTVINDWEALVDAEGNYFEIPEGYTLEGYSDGILLLSKNGLYGYYSIEGKWITQPIFTYARPFIQGLAVVGSATGTVGMIDTSGNIVLPFVYTSLSDVSSGVITAYCEGIGWETYYLMEK